MTPATGLYYDRLTRWTAIARWFGYGGGREALTVHRLLADPAAKGAVSATRLHDILIDALPSRAIGRALDAGCGLGGTMLDLASRVGGDYTGLTLSDRQAAIGNGAAQRAGLGDRVRLIVGTYDSPPPGPFDLVWGIESLAHSADPAVTVQALASRLSPGGVFIVIDDMPEPGAMGTQDLALFKSGWRLPVLWTADQYATCLAKCGLTALADRNLTPDMRPRSLRRIARLEAFNRTLHRLSWSPGFRAMLDSYHGGLALERLYRQGLMTYRLLAVRRPA